MSPREPSGASKKQKAAFSKTLKNPQFLMVFGPKGTPREPQETQNPPKRNPKRIKTTNKKIKKLAQKINILWTIVWDQKCSKYIPRKNHFFNKKTKKDHFLQNELYSR